MDAKNKKLFTVNIKGKNEWIKSINEIFVISLLFSNKACAIVAMVRKLPLFKRHFRL